MRFMMFIKHTEDYRLEEVPQLYSMPWENLSASR